MIPAKHPTRFSLLLAKDVMIAELMAKRVIKIFALGSGDGEENNVGFLSRRPWLMGPANSL